jgi:hypothetical protein
MARLGLSDHLGFLRRFKQQIVSGAQKLDGTLRRRSELYVLSAKVAYQNVRQDVKQFAGNTEMRRETTATESCPDCLDFAAQGWQPIGSLPLPGESSVCGSRCQCSVSYR